MDEVNDIDSDEIELKKLDELLIQYDKLYIEYMDLIKNREEIKIKYANKNKKEIIKNICFLMITTSLMLILIKYNLIELFELWPNICMSIYNGLFVLMLGYEGYLFFKRMSNGKIIYDGLSDDEDYLIIIKKVNEKTKELNELNVKFMNLDINDDLSKNTYVIDGNRYENNYSLEGNKNNLVRKRVRK